MNTIPFYDPERTYNDNLAMGPFGAFADGTVCTTHEPPGASFLGLPVHLPFGIAAGPLLNGKFVKAALDKGYDLAVYKTVRTIQRDSHPWPNVVPVAVRENLTPEEGEKGITAANEYDSEFIAVTNSFGVPSSHPDLWQQDLADCVKYARPGQVIIGSFQGTTTGSAEQYADDFVAAARLTAETGVPVLEANLSCPNEGTEELLCFDIDRVKTIVSAIKTALPDSKLILKAAYFREEAPLRRLVTEVGPLVEALSMINTIPAKILNRQGEQRLPGDGRLYSGVCGSPIRWAGLDMVTRVSKLRDETGGKFSIIGVGGVTSHEHYCSYIEAGADAVMCATGAMWNPLLAIEMKAAEGIESCCDLK